MEMARWRIRPNPTGRCAHLPSPVSHFPFPISYFHHRNQNERLHCATARSVGFREVDIALFERRVWPDLFDCFSPIERGRDPKDDRKD